MTVAGFEDWPESFTPAMRIVVDPPRPVIVDLAAVIQTRPAHFRADAVPMKVRFGGLRLADTTPGRLHAWARVSDGTWLGLVSFEIPTGNRQGKLTLTQWCPDHALRAQH